MNNHKYYLQIDNEIIDFDSMTNFENMNSYLNLSLFTSCYNNDKELIEGLKQMNLLSQNREYQEVIIVKRKGNKKNGYFYEPIYEEILYKKAARFLSVSAITDFLLKNKSNSLLIQEIITHYLDLLRRLTESFNNKVIELRHSLTYTAEDKQSKVLDEIKRRENSLKNFTSETNNLGSLLAISTKLERSSFLNRDLEISYIEFVNRFVRNETGYYIKDRKVSTNYRGLVRLANTIQHLIEKYQNVEMPEFAIKYGPQRIKMLKCIKNEILMQTSPNKLPDSDDQLEEVLEDPDSFMFLEIEDYEKLLHDTTSTVIRDGVMNDIENLQKQQHSYGKR